MKKISSPIAYELRFDTGEEIIRDSIGEQLSEIGIKMAVKLCKDFEQQLITDSLDRDVQMTREWSEPGTVAKNDYFYIFKTYEKFVQNAQEQGEEPLLFRRWFEMHRLQENDFLAWLVDERIPSDLDFNSTQPLDMAVPDLIKFDGWMNLIWSPIDLFYIPNEFSPLECSTTRYTINYVYNNKKWPIMSDRLLEDLTMAGEFQHRCYPIEVIDYTLAHASKTARSGRSSVGYQIVQTLECLDIFDWEKSQYTKHESLDNQIQSAEKVVLKKITTPLPSLFRISAYPSKLFVSDAVKKTTERNDYYGGVKFTPIDEEYKIY
jgi:hypothetical protein